jgi:arylsulfatase A-like enzyme
MIHVRQAPLRKGGPTPSRGALSALLLGALAAGGCCNDFKPFSVDPACPGFEVPAVAVMIFYVDGLRRDVLDEMAANGELPLLKHHILDRAASVQDAVTMIPGLTYANATSMVCGLNPSHHAVVANKWFDRDRLVVRNYQSKSTMPKANVDLAVPTIYEMLDDKLTAVIGMQVNKGSKIHYVVAADDGGLPAGVAWSLGYQEEVDEIMAEHIAELGKDARRLGRWPDLTLVYFPGPDDVAHFKGAASNEYRSALRSLDASLGAMLSALDRGGILDRITLVLTSDHGLHDVARNQYLDVARFARECVGIPAYGEETDLDEEVTYLDSGEDPLGLCTFSKVLVPDVDSSRTPYASRHRKFRAWPMVVTHSGERQASVHLRRGNEWSARPTLDEILWFHRDSVQTGRADFAHVTLPEVFLGHPAVGLAAVRDGDDAAQVYAKNGAARIERSRDASEPAYRYRVIAGDDPLFHGEAVPPVADGQFHDSRQWLEATASLRYPDAVAQIGSLFDHRRLGDMVLFASPGWDFSKLYLGGHGGLERDEMCIPLYFAGPGIAPGRRIPAARLVDVVPTVLDLMSLGDRAQRACRLDGVSIASQLRQAEPATRPPQ